MQRNALQVAELELNGLEGPSRIPVFNKQYSDRSCFLRERAALEVLGKNSPVGIVGLVDADSEKKSIILDLVPGNSLDKYLDSNIRFQEDEVNRIILGAAKALSYIHSPVGKARFAHYDVTPNNMVYDGERLTLIDFELAFPIEHFPPEFTKELVGTPLYRSPEHFLKRPEQGDCADLFSLGVVWYELLTNSLPFDPVLGNLERQILTYDPPAPALKYATQHTSGLVMRLLDKDAHKRPSAETLIKELSH